VGVLGIGGLEKCNELKMIHMWMQHILEVVGMKELEYENQEWTIMVFVRA
jgi:hypothetical protein